MRRHWDRHRRRVRVVSVWDVLAILAGLAWLAVIVGILLAVVDWVGGGM